MTYHSMTYHSMPCHCRVVEHRLHRWGVTQSYNGSSYYPVLTFLDWPIDPPPPPTPPSSSKGSREAGIGRSSGGSSDPAVITVGIVETVTFASYTEVNITATLHYVPTATTGGCVRDCVRARTRV